MRHMQRGFTLVELSIVLVIIGLLVGGVLMGSDLIKSAELRKQIRQVENYQSAVRVFRDKYHGVPGDLSAARSFLPVAQFPTIVNGNGDGNIYDASGTATVQFTGEISQFWMQLAAAGLVEGNFKNTTAVMGEGWPEAALSGGGVIGAYDTAQGYNAFYYGVSSTGGTGMIGTNIATPLDASKIDVKVDDGHPLRGIFVVRGSNAATLLYNDAPDYFDNLTWLPNATHPVFALLTSWIIPQAQAAATTAESACIYTDADVSGSTSTDDVSTKTAYALDATSANCQFSVRFDKH